MPSFLSARLHPPLLGLWNPEWLNARVQKLLTKNIGILYFDLPMSADYTQLAEQWSPLGYSD